MGRQMSKSVLIVEDNALVVEMYRSALKPLNVQLFEARNGEDALTLAALHSPALILMDILLPGANGYDVLKRIKALPHGGNAPVLAVTNAATAGDRAKMKEAGFEALITKPINVQNFVAEVRRHLAA
jgi:two-component system, cell cycle response regulator DivK